MLNFKLRAKILVCILAGMAIFFSCSALKPLLNSAAPQVQFKKMVITSLNFEGIELNALIDVQNPNAFGIPLNGLSYKLFIESEQLLAGEVPVTSSIPANADTTLGIPLSFNFNDVYHIVRNFSKRDSLPFRLEGKINVLLPVVGNRAFPFRHEQTIPRPKRPDFSLKFLKLKSLSFTRADLVLGISLKNDNPFKLLLSQFSYSFSLENSDWLSGTISDAPAILPGETRLLEVPISLNFSQLGSSLISILKNPGQISFSLKGNSLLNSDLPYLKNIPLNFEKAGKISIQK